MRLLVLVACVLHAPLVAWAEPHSEPPVCPEPSRAWRVERLRLRPIEAHRREGHALAHLFRTAETVGSDAQLRMDEMIHRAENTLMAAVENAQHLGSTYRSWLWVTPMSGMSGIGVYGAAVRFDYR